MASPGNSGPEVRVPIGVPVDTNAGEASDAIASMRDQIAQSKDAIRDMSSNLRNLRGDSDAVKAAKDQLRATIDREKAAVSEATLALIKQGTSFEKLADQQKKAAAAQEEAKKKADALKKANEDAFKRANEERAKAFGDAISKAGGPVASLRDKLSGLSEIAEKGGALGVVAMGAAAAVAAVVALTVAIGAATIAFAKWALGGADVARSMQLVREAALGSSYNATNLGTQVEALANKVPTTTGRLNELAASLARSRLGGQITVDTLNAVAQASAAIDDSAGAKIREIVERGKIAQRMFLGLRELEGTGLDFGDVASALADSMKVSVADARKALLEGRVKLGDGAKAMRDAVEKKFGDINLRKMMSLEGLAETLQKKLAGMTSGINFEPAARAAFKFLSVFDQSTATGAVLKRAVTVFGDGIVSVIERGAPIAREFIRGMIIGGLQMYVAYLQVKNALKGAFGDSEIIKNIDGVKLALVLGKSAVTTFATGVAVMGAAVGLVLAPFIYLGKIIWDTAEAGFRAYKFLSELDWSATGTAIVDGLVNGVTSGAHRVTDSIKGLAGKAKAAFKDALGIHSPSRDFFDEARQIPAGVKGGVEADAPKAQRAVADMIEVPKFGARASSGGQGGAGGAVSAVFHIHVTVQGDVSAEQVRSSGLLAELTKTFKEAAALAGITVANAG